MVQGMRRKRKKARDEVAGRAQGFCLEGEGGGGGGGRGEEDAMVGYGLSPPMIITRVLMLRALVFSCVDLFQFCADPACSGHPLQLYKVPVHDEVNEDGRSV